MSIELVMLSTISSSATPFSFCLQSFATSGSFPMSQFFKSGDQSIGASASVLPMNTQDWSPSGWTGWISLQSKGLSRVFSDTTVQKHQFFGAQPCLWSNSHICTWLLEKPQPLSAKWRLGFQLPCVILSPSSAFLGHAGLPRGLGACDLLHLECSSSHSRLQISAPGSPPPALDHLNNSLALCTAARNHLICFIFLRALAPISNHLPMDLLSQNESSLRRWTSLFCPAVSPEPSRCLDHTGCHVVLSF